MTDQPSTPESLRRLRAQLVARPLTLLGSVVLFVLLADNNTFWRIGSDVFSGHPFAFAGMVAALYCLTLAVFSPFCAANLRQAVQHLHSDFEQRHRLLYGHARSVYRP